MDFWNNILSKSSKLDKTRELKLLDNDIILSDKVSNHYLTGVYGGANSCFANAFVQIIISIYDTIMYNYGEDGIHNWIEHLNDEYCHKVTNNIDIEYIVAVIYRIHDSFTKKNDFVIQDIFTTFHSKMLKKDGYGVYSEQDDLSMLSAKLFICFGGIISHPKVISKQYYDKNENTPFYITEPMELTDHIIESKEYYISEYEHGSENIRNKETDGDFIKILHNNNNNDFSEMVTEVVRNSKNCNPNYYTYKAECDIISREFIFLASPCIILKLNRDSLGGYEVNDRNIYVKFSGYYLSVAVLKHGGINSGHYWCYKFLWSSDDAVNIIHSNDSTQKRVTDLSEAIKDIRKHCLYLLYIDHDYIPKTDKTTEKKTDFNRMINLPQTIALKNLKSERDYLEPFYYMKKIIKEYYGKDLTPYDTKANRRKKMEKDNRLNAKIDDIHIYKFIDIETENVVYPTQYRDENYGICSNLIDTLLVNLKKDYNKFIEEKQVYFSDELSDIFTYYGSSGNINPSYTVNNDTYIDQILVIFDENEYKSNKDNTIIFSDFNYGFLDGLAFFVIKYSAVTTPDLTKVDFLIHNNSHKLVAVICDFGIEGQMRIYRFYWHSDGTCSVIRICNEDQRLISVYETKIYEYIAEMKGYNYYIYVKSPHEF
jgi:hypothetical protein